MATSKKYELTGQTKTVSGHTLHRIRAVRDIAYPGYPELTIKKGTVGGYVETEANLSQTGAAWVHDTAMVWENARVYGNAQVSHTAKVHGNAEVFGNADVCNRAEVYGDARVYGEATVQLSAKIGGSSRCCGNAIFSGGTFEFGNG